MCVEEYAYYVNKPRLKTWIWRQIVTSQTAHTKYKWPPSATEWTPPWKFSAYAKKNNFVVISFQYNKYLTWRKRATVDNPRCNDLSDTIPIIEEIHEDWVTCISLKPWLPVKLAGNGEFKPEAGLTSLCSMYTRPKGCVTDFHFLS